MNASASTTRVAVVVPCYNEEAGIREVIRHVPAGVDLIVAVDDASTDATWQVLSGLDEPRLRAVRHERNRGVGGAMRSGYRRALDEGADIVVKMDGDGQMDPALLPRLIAPLIRAEADYAKGNRFNHVEALGTMPRIRLLGNGILSFLTKLASGYWSNFDPTNGYTAIRRDTLDRLDFDRLAESYFFESSMLIELNTLGAVVRDVEMAARYGEERSSLRISRVLLAFPPLLVGGLLRRFFWKYMVKDFNVLTLCVLAGVPAIVFGVTFGGYRWGLSIVTGVPATAGTTILAALPIILGVQCLLTALVLDVIYQSRRPLCQGSDPPAAEGPL
jgi:glycosyltransferase involved in cell wall biosynthesis